MSEQKHYVYALYEKGVPKIRYIGYTKNPKKRLKDHSRKSDNYNHAKFEWIQSVGSNDIKMKILFSSYSKSDALLEESRLIKGCREKGFNLFNIHDGGLEAPHGFKVKQSKPWCVNGFVPSNALRMRCRNSQSDSFYKEFAANMKARIGSCKTTKDRMLFEAGIAKHIIHLNQKKVLAWIDGVQMEYLK